MVVAPVGDRDVAPLSMCAACSGPGRQINSAALGPKMELSHPVVVTVSPSTVTPAGMLVRTRLVSENAGVGALNSDQHITISDLVCLVCACSITRGRIFGCCSLTHRPMVLSRRPGSDVTASRPNIANASSPMVRTLAGIVTDLSSLHMEHACTKTTQAYTYSIWCCASTQQDTGRVHGVVRRNSR